MAGQPEVLATPDDGSRAQWHFAGRLVLSIYLLGVGLLVLQNYLRARVGPGPGNRALAAVRVRTALK